MHASPLIVQRDGPVLTVTLDRPEKRNPISDPDMVEALVAVMQDADADLGVRAVILTGAGRAFSSGGDVAKMRAEAGGMRAHLPAQTRRNYKSGIQRLPLVFQALEVPVIAAVNGPAIGAGCDLACMCDVRIAAESARFAESFVKLGLIPGDGGAWLLPRIIGFSRATELALTGDQIDAATALEYGLVSRVVPDAQLMDAARAVAMKIAANPPHAVRMTKRLLREAQVSTLPNILELSAAMQGLAHQTTDHDEAIAAFVEKRAPAFRGD
ncbi:MAG TPA: crotonase/enoyl-CoA hydratase family protein [Pseudomonadales bacterium]|nr:crotonase/enoyl-CoA hydratase family protein [Pseudomonadales bacterium]